MQEVGYFSTLACYNRWINERLYAVCATTLPVADHQTHHRAQLTTMLSQAGYDPGITDLMWLPGMELSDAAAQ